MDAFLRMILRHSKALTDAKGKDAEVEVRTMLEDCGIDMDDVTPDVEPGILRGLAGGPPPE